MTRDSTHQQFWYTGVVLITKLNHYFLVSVNQKAFLGFRNNTNSRDTAPLKDMGNNSLVFADESVNNPKEKINTFSGTR